MAMRGWIVVPNGGLKLDGVTWQEGPREIEDEGWYRLLKAAGATDITEEEYERYLKVKVWPLPETEKKVISGRPVPNIKKKVTRAPADSAV